MNKEAIYGKFHYEAFPTILPGCSIGIFTQLKKSHQAARMNNESNVTVILYLYLFPSDDERH